ncbi:MAG TPA: endolytic transglycosylase MltG [Gemmatimonadaceae bacterium]|nr:endolytic transglycosylase MltG [Gemmatimonadaceae bacterium]
MATRPGERRARGAALGGLLILATACGGAPSGPDVRFTIRKGSPFREAADSLAAHGVVRSGRAFAIYAKLRGLDRSLRYGTYVVHQKMSWEQTLDALHTGRGIVHTVTIPEGFLISGIAELLSDELGISVDSIAVAVRDTALLHRLDVPTSTLEGYLFPDTYVFADGTTARSAVNTMVERFEQVWKPEWNARLQQLAMSRHDIITLASIVEMEVARSEERPVVAAVYMNRLKAGMNLQADPTVAFALGKKPGRVLLRDLRVKSPYNTYRVLGLPPGPIASPGAASIQAALYPAKVPYRFFVASPDGHHEFRRTYKEHLAAIEMVRHPAKPDSVKP